MRGAAYRLPLGVRLRGAVGAPPGRVALLVPALGLAFGFVAAVSGTAHATWFGLPSGVAAANYHTVGRRSALTGEFDRLTVADFRTLQQAVPQIEWAFADKWPVGRDLQNAGGEIPIIVREVSPRFFDVLGVRVAGAPREGAVVSHDFWQDQFAGAADVVGRAFSLKYERSAMIVGVAPADFADVFAGEADAWLLSDGTGYGAPGSGSRFRPWGKLAFGVAVPGLDHEALTAALAAISPVLELTMYDRTTFLGDVSPDDWLEAHRGLTAFPDRRSDAAVHFRWLAAVIAGLLLLAVLSLIDFAATRTAKSDGHATARIAAGATPAHLFRESVVRNGVWLLLVAVISALSFFWLAGVLLRVEPFRSYLAQLPAGSQIVGVGVGAVLIGISFCGAISWVARRDFRASRSFSAVVGSGPPRRRTERLLLFLAVLGLVLATSLLARYVADSGRGLGFDAEDVWGFLPLKAHGLMLSDSEADALVDQIGAMPGVHAASRAGMAPLQPPHVLPTARVQVRAAGSALKPAAETGRQPTIYRNAVGPGYFDTIRARFVVGRPFSSTSEAVVSEALVDILGLEHDDVLGLAVEVGQPDELVREFSERRPGVVTVVGIVDDIPYGQYDDPPRPVIYQGLEHQAIYDLVVVRYGGDWSRLENRVREAFPLVRSMNAELMTDVFAAQFMQRRAIEVLIAAASAFTFGLAFAGLAMSLAREVAQDRRNIGIQMAFGATRRAIVQGRLRTVWLDLGLAWVAGFALVVACKVALPGALDIVELWQAVPILLALAVSLVLLTYLLVRSATRSPVIELVQGVDARAA